ncbi:Sec-independent protein translocase protein TatB [Chitinilyticum piscinae]|uniref:Sec-independent protein translocase protein TatB n=1 Tax=Chitinilyticum piscinae TaxID=2866724 RepID=A0A8J7KAJ1_9NEIS|nr:Sec-independent protein translocase protein TatB [Chitinilyticum piscinae]MBE9609184.1 twin-arginine translocase subunit TatB [Chitinilyticum piscinae]
MFDVSFGELLLVGAVALVVLGPERLPKVARTAGVLLGRAQRFVASVKNDLNQQIAHSELAQIEAELRKEAGDIRQQLETPLASAVDRLPALQTPESLGIAPLAPEPEPLGMHQATVVPPAASQPPDAAQAESVPDTPAAKRPRKRKPAAPEPAIEAAADSSDGQLDLFASDPLQVSASKQQNQSDRR